MRKDRPMDEPTSEWAYGKRADGRRGGGGVAGEGVGIQAGMTDGRAVALQMGAGTGGQTNGQGTNGRSGGRGHGDGREQTKSRADTLAGAHVRARGRMVAAEV